MFADFSEYRTGAETEDTAVPQVLFGAYILACPCPCRFFSEGETTEGLQGTGCGERCADLDISIPGIWPAGRDTVRDTMTMYAKTVAEREGSNERGSRCDQVVRGHNMQDTVLTVLLFDGQGGQTDRGCGIALPWFDDNILLAGVAAGDRPQGGRDNKEPTRPWTKTL
jgi:hypothetical protein